MAEFGDLLSLPFRSGEDLRARQYHVVRLMTTAGDVGMATSPTSNFVFGVLQNKPNSLEHATVAIFGESKVIVGSAVSYGDLLTVSASGRAVKVSSGNMAFGRALATVSNDGEYVRALLFPAVRWSGAA